jgi:membrane peptidoglycan carboxypeptidase
MDPALARPVPSDAPGARVQSALRRRARPRSRFARLAIAAALLLIPVLAALAEMRTSLLQALVFSTVARQISFKLEPGASAIPRAPDGGPYDARLGYNRLPGFVERLRAAGYVVESQARPSPRLAGLGAWGAFPIYHEKDQAGLSVTDRAGRALSEARFPTRSYERFEAIPPAVVEALLFVENRDLLDPRRPHLNPGVDWYRLAKAMGLDALSRLGRQGQMIGASTLATQIEKFRHSPDGRTRSASDKLKQMLSASLRAYQDGSDTLPARRRIVKDYLNSMPLAAVVGRGEILGLGDGLGAWYGMDFADANRRLQRPGDPRDAAGAQAYKRVLSLILAVRRPYYYLTEDQAALEEFTDSYLRIMARAGVIDERLRDAALAQALDFRALGPLPPVDWSERKGANLVRVRLTSLLAVPALYELDRFDLTAQSTLNGSVQDGVSRLLSSLRAPAAVQALGLKGFHLLERGDPSRVLYSMTLYERGPRANLVRVQTDNLDQPLDLNAGARLDLGSTAKLRTLITYLEAIADIHAKLGSLGAAERRATEVHKRDRLTAWAIDYLAQHPAAGLPATLDAAMERRYSASPGEAFATGGGLQSFHNFDREDDARIMSVREGFRHSVNLVFIRLMRDVVDHYLYAAPASLARVLEDPDDPDRPAYLSRFADREGSEFIRRFYRKYQDRTPEEALDLVLSAARSTPRALCAALRSVDADPGVDVFKAVLAARLPGEHLSERVAEEVYGTCAPARLTLMDRGFVARVHPLELWLVAYLRQNPEADLAQVLAESAAERQAVYGWLLRTRHRHAQDKRIRNLLEVEAFLEIQRAWQRLGYPFASITPSLATAIGSSGDRPAALARLMGIIVNEGMSYPTVLVERLIFAAGTPYETRLLRPAEGAGERVMTPDVTRVVRHALVDVVERGTAQSLRGALGRPTGDSYVAGGKTGTGDHRYETFAPGGRLIESRVVERAATFVFLIGDRFFGTITAYVAGRQASQYEFTSALPVRLLAILMPTLSPLLDGEEPPSPGASPVAAAPAAAPR